jgi:purine-binding chemotaxis protein CheW
MEIAATCSALQYLTFRLAGELFGIDIAKVREVLEFSSVTKVPGVPAYMRGVINLRGEVVPVVDLRLKLGLPAQDKLTKANCVVITEVAVNGEPLVLGTLVDSVQEVLELEAGSILPPPRIGTHVDGSAISGLGKRDEEFVIVLDIDRVFLPGELTAASAGVGKPCEGSA